MRLARLSVGIRNLRDDAVLLQIVDLLLNRLTADAEHARKLCGARHAVGDVDEDHGLGARSWPETSALQAVLQAFVHPVVRPQ